MFNCKIFCQHRLGHWPLADPVGGGQSGPATVHSENMFWPPPEFLFFNYRLQIFEAPLACAIIPARHQV